MRLFGYVYNSGARDSKELATINIGEINTCLIAVKPGSYLFSVNGKIDSLPRFTSSSKAEGYKLYPYFGGDEVAPHEVTIEIKDL